MFNGSSFLILANTGTDQSPVYEAVGSQRDASVDETTEIIDYSNKEGRARRVGPGRYSSTVSLDGLYVPNDAAYAVLKAAMRAGTTVLIAREESDVVIETATAVVASLSETFPDQAEATVSASFEIDDEWELVGS
jgi:hypothetical protein